MYHQYGISVTESHRFLLTKCQKQRGARRKDCFRRLIPHQLEILAKDLPHVNDFVACVSKYFQY